MPIPAESLGVIGALSDTFVKDVAALAATTTTSIMCATAANGYRFRVNRAQILVDTTFAADASNFWVFTLVHNATTVATWSTQTGQQGALTAFTVNEMVLAADTANALVIQPGEVLTLVATKNASAANFTGRFISHGRFS